ncbi:hypothetical protein AS593_15080 [Caulobacter vibrioides]|nr:hypothetical protein AS593_15080 [Caulobacter vibrioides]
MKCWAYAFVGLGLLATPVAAAEACATRPAAKLVPIPSTDMQNDLVALMSMGPALQAKPVQHKALLKAKPKCDAPGFQAGNLTYTVFEPQAAGAALIARSGDANAPVFFVTPFADMTAAVLAEIEKRPAPAASTRYLLVVSNKAGASVLRLYESVPDDVALKADVVAALQGGLRPLVSRDDRNQQIRINIQADAYEGPKSTPGATPAPGTGLAPPASSAFPQNQSFKEQDGDGALHAASGFTCPAKIDGFERIRLTVYDSAQGGRDVSCGFQTRSATATLYLTRLPEQYTLTRVFDIYVQQAKAQTPPVSDLQDPYPASAGGPRRLGKFWRDDKGRGEGLWLVQIGPWFAKLRVTYSDADAAGVARLAADLLTAVEAEVKPPTV